MYPYASVGQLDRLFTRAPTPLAVNPAAIDWMDRLLRMSAGAVDAEGRSAFVMMVRSNWSNVQVLSGSWYLVNTLAACMRHAALVTRDTRMMSLASLWQNISYQIARRLTELGSFSASP